MAKVPDEDGKSNADAGPSLLAERLAGLTVPLEPDLRTQELAAQVVDVWFDAWAAAVERMTVHPFGAPPFHRFPSDAPTTQLLVELHRLAVLAVGVANTGVGTIRPGSLRFLDEMLGATFESSLQAEVKISKEKLGGVARVARAQAVLDAALRARQTAGLVLGTFPSAGTHPLGALLDEALYVASVGAALGDPVMARAYDVLRTIDVQLSKGVAPLEKAKLSHAAFTQRGTPAKVLRGKAAIVQFLAGLGPRTDAQREELKPGLAVLHVAITHGRRNGARCFNVLTQCRQEVRADREHEDVLLWVIGRALALFGHDGDTPQAQPRVADKRADRRAKTLGYQATDTRRLFEWVKGAFGQSDRPWEYVGFGLPEFRELINGNSRLREWVDARPEQKAKLSRSRSIDRPKKRTKPVGARKSTT